MEAEQVIKRVAELTMLTPEEIKGRRRGHQLSLARRLVMYILREQGDMKMSEIGQLLGGRDAMAVSTGCRWVRWGMDHDPGIKYIIKEVSNG